MEVRNRFTVLCDEDVSAVEGSVEDLVSRRYGNFITVIAAANETLVPKRKKKFREDYSADPRVCVARRHLTASRDQYYCDPTEHSRLLVEEKKEMLNAVYTEAREEVLIERISRVESTADRCNNWES